MSENYWLLFMKIFKSRSFYHRILKERSRSGGRKRGQGQQSVKEGPKGPNPWFGPDGRLMAGPNPVQRSSTRPTQILNPEDLVGVTEAGAARSSH